MNTRQQQTRPVSIPHLVFGVIFTGVAAVWAIGQATDADLPRSAIAFPVVLILAGAVGLVASLAGARSRTNPVQHDLDPAEEPVVLEDTFDHPTQEEM